MLVIYAKYKENRIKKSMEIVGVSNPLILDIVEMELIIRFWIEMSNKICNIILFLILISILI